MTDPDPFITAFTESGDRYTGRKSLWKAYWESVETDWKEATRLEEGVAGENFYYDAP